MGTRSVNGRVGPWWRSFPLPPSVVWTAVVAISLAACSTSSMHLPTRPAEDLAVRRIESDGFTTVFYVPPLPETETSEVRDDPLRVFFVEFQNQAGHTVLIQRSTLLLVLVNGDAFAPLSKADALSQAVRPVKWFREYYTSRLVREYCEGGIDAYVIVRPGESTAGYLFYKIPRGYGPTLEGAEFRLETRFLQGERTSRRVLPLYMEGAR